jgi:hypothetical protein
MSPERSAFPKQKSTRVVLFADLRNSTDILLNFEQDIYQKTEARSESGLTFEEFILDVDETSYEELYLGHGSTYAEIYRDGVMGVFPEDNTKYLLDQLISLRYITDCCNSVRHGVPPLGFLQRKESVLWN